MENQELEALNLKGNEEKTNEKNDLDVLNLKKQEKKSGSYDNLEGTGVKPLRIISDILIILGFVLLIIGVVQLANSSSYHPEREYIGLFCFYIAISCFVVSPIYKVLATIGEAAKIFKDKNTK